MDNSFSIWENPLSSKTWWNGWIRMIADPLVMAAINKNTSTGRDFNKQATIIIQWIDGLHDDGMAMRQKMPRRDLNGGRGLYIFSGQDWSLNPAPFRPLQYKYHTGRQPVSAVAKKLLKTWGQQVSFSQNDDSGGIWTRANEDWSLNPAP